MEIWKWLIDQAPIIVILGIVIGYMYKYIKNKDEIIERKDKVIASKDDKIIEISEKVIEVATLWDVKSDINSKEHQNLLNGLDDLKQLANNIRHDCRKS